MKNYLTIILVLAITSFLNGQIAEEANLENPVHLNTTKKFYKENYKLTSSLLIKAHLSKNIDYSSILKENGIEGRVIIKVDIDAYGKYQHMEIFNSPHRALDSVVITAVDKNPFPVMAEYKDDYTVYVPINFSLKPF